MKDTEQRIAIAKHLGYPNPRMGEFGRCYAGEVKNLEEVPDYLNDLNAMHEAEKILNDAHLWNRYRGWLLTWMTEPICATAAQRAEAFLRTLNLWKP